MSDGKPEDNKEALEKNDDLTRVHQGRESGKGDVNEEKLRSQPAPQKKPVSPDDKTNIAISPSPPSSDFYSESVEPESSDDFTILQPHEKANSLIAEDRTELSYQPEEDEDQKTILMGPGEPDDNTYVPGDADQDATILSNNETMATFVASSKADLKSGGKGNSEAGRLLKNRFVLEERIGSGGMGDVYKALDLRAQEARERNPYIAIKILNENFARHRDAFISLQREYSKTRGIPHENIMAVYDFDREGDTVFMSMELLDGEPLDDFLKKHKDGLDEEDARQIIKDYCQGLIRAHGAGIVHSDFKPGNIYYTTGKTAKVFDFGIARAVSTPGELSSEGDHTVFDAGTLGALTPTYASYEMLTGQSPSKSDDVFAAALVAYEIFTGRHPYNRIPADKAYQQGLEPDPIPFLKKRHWRALKKALGLRAQERTESLEEFYEGLFSEDPPVLRYSFAALGLVLLIGYGVYQAQDSELDAQIASRQSLLNENKERIEIRLKNVTLEDFRGRAWHNDLKIEISKIREVNRELMVEFQLEADPMVEAYERSVIDTYTKQIQNLWEAANGLGAEEPEVIEALKLLEEAREYALIAQENYALESDLLRMQVTSIASGIQFRELQLETLNREKTAAELAEARRAEERRKNEVYNTNVQELTAIIKSCKDNISDQNLERLEKVIPDMKSTLPGRFNRDRPGIASALAGCIANRIAPKNPERARLVKTRVDALLPEAEVLDSVVIRDKDPCAAANLVGQGSRGRGWCTDKLSSGGYGPELVVIPKGGRIKENYAITRLEILVKDYNRYCEAAGCKKVDASNSLPVTGISLKEAKAYAAWLSEETGKKYRLPALEEWRHAAVTDKKESLDDNINCTVISRGVRLGEKLVNSLSGKPNGWGLYNFVGNAREWVEDNKRILAVGGAHTDLKTDCSVDTQFAHSGEADSVTGFRLIREI